MGDEYCYDEQFATLSHQLAEINKNLEKIIELMSVDDDDSIEDEAGESS